MVIRRSFLIPSLVLSGWKNINFFLYMAIIDQVLSISQMLHLKELGIDTSKASMALVYRDAYGDIVEWEIVAEWHELDIGEHNPYIRSLYGTFTFKDLLDLLPKEISSNRVTYNLFIDYHEMHVAYCFVDRYGMSWVEPTFSFFNRPLLDALYKMLVWCIENNYIKVNKDK